MTPGGHSTTPPPYLNPLVPPFYNEVSIDFYRELPVINFENFEVIKSNLDFCRRLPWGIERRVEFAVVRRNTKHVVYGAVPTVELVIAQNACNIIGLLTSSCTDWTKIYF